MRNFRSTAQILLTTFAAVSAGAGPNVLLICVDDLRPELGCYGVNYIQSPHIDRLASKGRVFNYHYVQAPTCGASRYALLTGTYGPSSNHALFQRAKAIQADPAGARPSLPAWFRKHGYETVSVGKVSHHPGGLGGDNWNDPKVLEMPHSWDLSLMPTDGWEHPRGAMHGLANGEIRMVKKHMDVQQSKPGTFPDDLITEAALKQIQRLADERSSFFLAVGLLKPHLPFGAPERFMDPYRNAVLPPIPHPEKPQGVSTWHNSGEFFQYNTWNRDPRTDQAFAEELRRHYAACVSYADDNIGRMLDKLEETGLADNTIIVLWGDHGWHLGEHAIWGKHSLYEESLRSPLILKLPSGLPEPGSVTDAVAETIDVYPTLCDLAGLRKPEFLRGTSLLPQLKDPRAAGHKAISYVRSASTIRTTTHRLIAHDNGQMELYDHTRPEKETLNLAPQHPEMVEALHTQLKAALDQTE